MYLCVLLSGCASCCYPTCTGKPREEEASYLQYLFQHLVLYRVELSSVIHCLGTRTVLETSVEEKVDIGRERNLRFFEIANSLAKEFQLSKWFSHMERHKQMDTYALRSLPFI